jgi:tetratricopeptide (TPR) repeat protein
VYVAVARMYGEGRPPPRLLVVPSDDSSGGIAEQFRGTEGLVGTGSRHEEGYIAVSEKAYDLLAAGSSDDSGAGLAFVLGHELAHYYMRHGWVGNFGNAFTGSRVGMELARALPPEQVTAFEVQADYLGGIYSYLAGYDSLEAAPHTLDLLYRGFGIPAAGKQRPTLAERKEIASFARKELDRLIPAFEAATVLMLLGNYDDAARLYDYLAKAAPSREFSGNAGVARIHQAMGLFGSTDIRYVFPVEIDVETRLRRARSKALTFQPNPVEQRTALLEVAVENLEQAVALAPEYATAHVNLAAALALLGRTDDALEHADKARRLAKRDDDQLTLANALIMRGIIRAGAGDDAGAREEFSVARAGNQRLASLNLALLAGEKMPAPREGHTPELPETIAGVAPESLLRPARSPGNDFVLRGFDNSRLSVRTFGQENRTWRGMLIEQGSSGKLALLRAGLSYEGQTALGVVRGADSAELRRAYGEPDRSFAARQGSFVAYDRQHIIFIMDRSDAVTSWILFRRL